MPSESRQYRERGVISNTMQQVLDMRAERTHQMAREQNTARQYWEGQEAELGITRDLPMAEKIERLSQARAHTITHTPERLSLGDLREQQRELVYRITGLELHIQRLGLYHRREVRLEQWRERRAWT